MNRLTPYERESLVKCFKNCKNISLAAKIFGVCFNTAKTWINRAFHPGKESFKDKPRKDEGKVTLEIELSILALRNTFNWGTARIQQGLRDLPNHKKKAVPMCVQGIRLSRTTINNVVTKESMAMRKNRSAGNSLGLKNQMSYGS